MIRLMTQDLPSLERKVPAVNRDVNQFPTSQRTAEKVKPFAIRSHRKARRRSLRIFCGSCVRILCKRAVLHTSPIVLFSFSNPVAIPYRQEKDFKRL